MNKQVGSGLIGNKIEIKEEIDIMISPLFFHACLQGLYLYNINLNC